MNLYLKIDKIDNGFIVKIRKNEMGESWQVKWFVDEITQVGGILDNFISKQEIK